MTQVHFDQITQSQIVLYNIVCLLGLLHVYWKSDRKEVSSLIIFLFAGGVFSDISNQILGTKIWLDSYKAIVFLWSTFLFVKNLKYVDRFKTPFLLLSLFGIYFLVISFLYHNDNLSLVLSQLSKYISPFFITIALFAEMRADLYRRIKLHSLFLRLLLLQILLAVAKLFILGSFMEGWVGSITGVAGGGVGTSLPLLALFWLLMVSNMKINTRIIIFTIGLLFIGIMTGKRAVIVLFPLLYILVLVFVSSFFANRRNIGYIFSALLFIIGMFYLGLRLTPTLNPENKVWGSFDINYAYDYGLKYSAGIDESNRNVQEGTGRVGGFLLFWNDIQNSRDIKRVAFGLGNEYMAYADKDDYMNSDYYLGIHSRGSITGIVYMYFTIGLIGVILILLYLVSLYSMIEYKRFRYFLLFTVLFDFIFYNAQMIQSIPMFVFQLFIVISANNSFDKQGNFIFNRLRHKYKLKMHKCNYPRKII